MKGQLKLNGISEKTLLIIAFGILMIYYLPYFILGENAQLLILDNLDSNVVWAKLMLEAGAVLKSPQTLVPNVFNGLSASYI